MKRKKPPMKWLKVHNWDRLQSLGNGKGAPPWFKLWVFTLYDPAFNMLPERHGLHLIKIWGLATRFDGRVPDDPRYVRAIAETKSLPPLDRFVRDGWLDRTDEEVQASDMAPAPLSRAGAQTRLRPRVGLRPPADTPAPADTREHLRGPAHARASVPDRVLGSRDIEREEIQIQKREGGRQGGTPSDLRAQEAAEPPPSLSSSPSDPSVRPKAGSNGHSDESHWKALMSKLSTAGSRDFEHYYREEHPRQEPRWKAFKTWYLRNEPHWKKQGLI